MAEKEERGIDDGAQDDGQDSREARPFKDVDEKIQSFRDEANLQRQTTRQTIFKFDDPNKGNTYQKVGYFTGEEVMNSHEIGLRFGSGRYHVICKKGHGDKKGDYENFTFKLHPVYDEYKRKNDELRADQFPARSVAVVPQQANASTKETFQIVESILGLLLPVIRSATERPPQQVQQQQGPKGIFEEYLTMQKILKANLFDTAATYRDMARRFASLEDQRETGEGDDTTDTPEADDMQPKENMLEKIIKMIEPFFALIAQKSLAARAAAATLKAAPAFADVLKDPQLCRLIITYFDRTKGRKMADQALQNIGIRREQFFQQAAPVPRPPAAQPPAVQPRQKIPQKAQTKKR